MRSPRLRFLAAVAAPLVLVAAGCSPDDDSGSTDDSSVTSSPGDDAAVTSAGPAADLSEVSVEDGENPTLTWQGGDFADGPLPFVTYETQVEQIAAGDGAEVGESDEVEVRYLTVNGANGEPVVNTFESGDTVTMELANEALFPGFRDNLPGMQEGESALLALPAADAFGEAGNPQLGVGPQDTLVFYLEVESTGPSLTSAEGEEVEPEEGLPTVEADGQSPAQIDVDGVDAPDELVVQPLVQGDRKEVQLGHYVRVHYTGVKLSDGEQFDSSYDRDQPFEFQVGSGQVITGWDEGLIGQNVGSRVLLVIPAEEAYGPLPEDTDTETAPPAHELAGEDLVFVVDILGAY